MSMQREVLEGIGAFTAINNTMKKNSQAEFYDYMLQRKKKQDAEDEAAFKRGAAGGGVPMPAPVTAGAIQTQVPQAPTFNDGGMVSLFADGGSAQNMGEMPAQDVDQWVTQELQRIELGDQYGGTDPSAQLNQRGEDWRSAYEASVPNAEAPPSAEAAYGRLNAAGRTLAFPPTDPAREHATRGDVDRIDDALAKARINHGVGKPQAAQDPSRQLSRRGSQDRASLAQGQAQLEGVIPAPRDYPVDLPNLEAAAPAPSEPDGVNPSTQINHRGRLDRAKQSTMERNIPAPRDTEAPGLPRSSKIGRAVGPAIERYLKGAPGYEKREQLEQDLYNAREGVFEQTTELERKVRGERVKQLEQELADLDAAAPAAAPPAAAQPAPSNPDAPAPPAGGAPRPVSEMTAQNAERNMGNDAPSLARSAPGNGAPVPPTVSTPPVGNPKAGPAAIQTGGPGPGTGGGIGGSPTPAPPPGGQRLPLNNQKRTDAFNPDDAADRAEAAPATLAAINTAPAPAQVGNPTGNGPRLQDSGMNPQGSTQGMSSNNAVLDLGLSLKGAVEASRQQMQNGTRPEAILAGQGAISPQTTQAIVQKFGANGQLSPGEAMLAGLVEVYKTRVGRGDIAGAGALAFGIIQRANIEAATGAKSALAKIQQGNIPGAAKDVAAAHQWVPDGTTMSISPDGRVATITDLQGKSQQVPVDGRWVLAAALGMSNGSMMWTALNQHVAMLNKDKNAANRQAQLEGIQLSNQLKRKKLAGGGAGAPAGGSFRAQLQNLVMGTQPKASPTINVNVEAADNSDSLNLDGE